MNEDLAGIAKELIWSTCYDAETVLKMSDRDEDLHSLIEILETCIDDLLEYRFEMIKRREE